MSNAQEKSDIWLRDAGLIPVPARFYAVNEKATTLKSSEVKKMVNSSNTKEQREDIRKALVIAIKSGMQYYSEVNPWLIANGITSATKFCQSGFPFASRTTLLRILKEERDKLGTSVIYESDKILKLWKEGSSREEIVAKGYSDDYIRHVLKAAGIIKDKYKKRNKNVISQ